MPLVKMPENANWDTDINVPDTGDNAYGGINGNMFVGLKSLVNRVLWLKNALNSLSSTVSGTNTGDETADTIKNKLGITTLSGANTGDETAATIKTKLNITTLSGANTGDETAATIKTKLNITTLSGANTGDETALTIRNKLGVYSLVANIRLGAVVHFITNWGYPGIYDSSGSVLTGAVSSQGNAMVDNLWSRPLQVTFDNVTWYNVASI
jgi:hypothetical protein